MTQNNDFYKVLGVERDADDTQIKKAFRKRARELHPDSNSEDPQAEEKFKEAAEAYEVLSDPERRAIYDRYGREGLSSQGFQSSTNFEGFGSFSDIFEAFFGGDPFGGAFGGRRQGPAQGADIAAEAEISLKEAADGTTVDVTYEVVAACENCRGNGAEPGTPIETCGRCGGVGQLQSMARTAFGQVVRTHPCDACGGEGKIAKTPCRSCGGRGKSAVRKTLSVDVPAGIADDQRIRLTGRGHAGERGGPSGDLYVLVHVAEDDNFVRQGDDLVTAAEISAPAAALGTTITVPTLDGDTEVDVAAGTQPGEVITLRGHGMPSLRGRRRGDQQVVINVVTPRKLSERQQELLAELRDSLDEDNLSHARGESLFARVKRALR